MGLMHTGQSGQKKRVAMAIDLDWGYKRHLETYAGCQRYADEAGWESSITPTDGRVLVGRDGELLFDGVIARVTEALAGRAEELGVPIVNVWLNSPVKDVPTVTADFREAGIMAAEHLLGRGFRNFGFLGYSRDKDAMEELEGFRETLKEHGFRCSTHRFSRTSMEGRAHGWEQFMEELDRWVDTWEPPVGIFVCNDLYCRHLMDVCRRKGLHVSQDVAIVGMGNEPAICNSPAPTLSSIDMGFERIGYRAAALLDQLMDGDVKPVEPVLLPPMELVPRQSSDSYAASDPLVSRALRYIAEHSHDRIQVENVAKAVATTRRTLERRFRESLDRTIAGEITRFRIERSKRLMVETDEPLKAIARDSGFLTSDHFYKVFLRETGMPPSQYRAIHQKDFPNG
jgi:LacI family transcriptional regulator